MDDQPAVPRKRPRRWPWVIVAALLLIGWFTLTMVHPTPRHGSSFGARRAEWSGSRYRFTYEHRGTGRYLFSLRNPGPLPVTITGMDLRRPEPQDSFLIAQTELQMGRVGEVSPAKPIPFRPFRLAGGEERALVVTVRFDNCEDHWTLTPADKAQGLEIDPDLAGHFWGTETIRYRVLGLEHTVEIKLPGEIGVLTPPRKDCPGAA